MRSIVLWFSCLLLFFLFLSPISISCQPLTSSHHTILSTLHDHPHLSSWTHIIRETTNVRAVLAGEKSPQEAIPGITIEPTPNTTPGVTVFAPTNAAIDAAPHLSHIDLTYHMLPLSLSLTPVDNHVTSIFIRTMSLTYASVQEVKGQAVEVVVVPMKHNETSSYVIFGTPYSPHNIAHIVSSISCTNGMIHIIDHIMTIPATTSETMMEMSDTYQHKPDLVALLLIRDDVMKQEKQGEKVGKEHVHHHDRQVRRGISKFVNLMHDYAYLNTVDNFRGITVFVPADIETKLHHYNHDRLALALLQYVVPGPPIYSFASMLDGASTRTITLNGISGAITLTIQRRTTPVIDTTDAITVMLNGHVVNPIPSLSRNGVVYVVDSCLPNASATDTADRASCADQSDDIIPDTVATTVMMESTESDREARRQLEERLKEMHESFREQQRELLEHQREMERNLRERERELMEQYQTRGHGEQREQREQREQPEQREQEEQREWAEYGRSFIPTPPKIIHIGVGGENGITIVIRHDGTMEVSREERHREKCEKQECEREREKEKERQREKEKEHEHEKECEKEEREHEREKEKEHEREKEKEREHEKERQRDKEKECECEEKDEKCREECKHKHAHAHHDKHGDKCEKEECDKHEPKHEPKHEHKHDDHKHERDDDHKHEDTKHRHHDHKYDTKSTSDVTGLTTPELDPSVYDGDDVTEDHEEQPVTATNWKSILMVGILAAMALACAATGYCCMYFQSRHAYRINGMGPYPAPTESTHLLGKPVTAPVRPNITKEGDDTMNGDVHETDHEYEVHMDGMNGNNHKKRKMKSTNGSNGNGCSYPGMHDHVSGSDTEPERYMIQTGNGHTNGNGHVPRSDAVNIITPKPSPK